MTVVTPLLRLLSARPRVPPPLGEGAGPMMQTIIDWVTKYGYAGIFSLLMLGIIGLPVPDETLLLFIGYLCHRGNLQLGPTLIAAFLGACCGITVSYGLGLTAIARLLRRYGRYVAITPERLALTHEFFERAGKRGLFYGYFIPGVRHLSAIVAGTSRLEFHYFALFAYSGAALWTSTFILLGYSAGRSWAAMSEQIQRVSLIITGVGAIAVLVYLLLRRRRGRRDARGGGVAPGSSEPLQ